MTLLPKISSINSTIALSHPYRISLPLEPQEWRVCWIVSVCLFGLWGYWHSQSLYSRFSTREGSPRLIAWSLAQPAVHRPARAPCTARNTRVTIGVFRCGFVRALSSSIGAITMLRPLAKTTVLLVCIMKSVHLYGMSTTGKCKHYVIGVRTSLV